MATISNALANKTDLNIIQQLLSLEGLACYQMATRSLHRLVGSYSTNIIEIDRSLYKGKVITAAGESLVDLNLSYPLKDLLDQRLVQAEQPYAIYQHAKHHQSQSQIDDKHNNVYLAVPILNKDSDILAILLSRFHGHIPNQKHTIDLHVTVAKVISQKWLNQLLTFQFNHLVQQMDYEISHDSLTGLSSRNCLVEQLDTLIDNECLPFNLVYLDIENFKSVNDLYGHYMGDQVIKFVANSIFKFINKPNQVFRIAGDEFAFITFSSDPLKICQLILDDINRGYTDHTHHITIRLNVGLAQKSVEPITTEQLILNASLALKDCKQSQEHQIRCYNRHLSHFYSRQNKIIHALRQELQNPIETWSQIYVEIQPIIHLEQPSWRNFEVLIRWRHPQLGSIPALEFIGLAEQSGLIIALSERIIALACEAKQTVETALADKVIFNINCSAYELTHSQRYLHFLSHTIASFGFQPDEFIIEITETSLLSKTVEVSERLAELRSLGFKIALDDFGTGYSSLNYIHSYPIDCIKIDATFIRNLLLNQTSEHVVSLIIQLAKQLNVKLVAEGVEHKQELEKLYAMGCHNIQGYYFAKPHAPDAMIQLIKKKPTTD